MCDFWCATCLIGIQLFRITVPDPINIVTAAFDPRAAAVPLTATQAEAFWRRLWELRKAGATLAIRDLDRLCDWLEAPDAPARQFDPNPTVSHQGDVVVLSPELLGMRSIAYGNFVIGNVLHASIPASASFDNRPTWDNWTRAK
jgi:hypothetical protein